MKGALRFIKRGRAGSKVILLNERSSTSSWSEQIHFMKIIISGIDWVISMNWIRPVYKLVQIKTWFSIIQQSGIFSHAQIMTGQAQVINGNAQFINGQKVRTGNHNFLPRSSKKDAFTNGSLEDDGWRTGMHRSSTGPHRRTGTNIFYIFLGSVVVVHKNLSRRRSLRPGNLARFSN